MKKETFDNIIRDNIITKTGKDCFGYVVSDTSKRYNIYYDNQSFFEFVKNMKSSKYRKAFDSYDCGKGSELKEHIGRYGKLPPKMASVASSSRFCFLALKDGANAFGGTGEVVFEHECRINGISGIAPQLDAYIPNENIFIEVKCHEIFDSHRIVMKRKYWDLIYGADNKFGLYTSDKLPGETFEIPLSVFGINKSSSMFDLKQFLCHLLGIESQAGDSKMLAYLFFKPKSTKSDEQKEIDEIFYTLKGEITAIFQSEPVRRFCTSNNIKLWAVAEQSRIMEPLTAANMETICKLG